MFHISQQLKIDNRLKDLYTFLLIVEEVALLIVGLTGGYASGKSTVAKIFTELGAILIDADRLARDVVKPDKQAWFEIVAHFGKGILLKNREIDRKALGGIIFKNEVERERLNDIVHPRVLDEELKAIGEIKAREPDAVVILSVPLLLESGHHNQCDKIVVVTVDRETQIKRLMKRDGFSMEESLRRISAQMPLSEKITYADFVINNNGSIGETEFQVKEVFIRLRMPQQDIPASLH